MKKIVLIIMMMATFLGCSSAKSQQKINQNKINSNGLPNWVFNSTAGGKYKMGGVGVSKRTIDGVTKQREIAISRAIDEIAKQMGVKVSNTSYSHSTKNNSSFEQYSLQTVEGKKVNAVIKEIWYNEETGELYVWMVVE